MAHRKTSSAAVRVEMNTEQRREAVMQNIRAGVPYRTIADNLSISIGLVAKDKKAIIAEWKKRYADDYSEFVITQLARYERLLNSVWESAITGENSKIDRALHIMSQMNALMGANKMQLDITSDGKPIEVKNETVIYNLSPEQIMAAQKAYHAALPYGETDHGSEAS